MQGDILTGGLSILVQHLANQKHRNSDIFIFQHHCACTYNINNNNSNNNQINSSVEVHARGF